MAAGGVVGMQPQDPNVLLAMLSSHQQQHYLAQQQLYDSKVGQHVLANQDNESDSNDDNIEAHNKRHQRIFDDDEEDADQAS
jgi:hypothetical protein